MIPYLVVLLVAAAATYAVTPLVARVAVRIGAVDHPGDPRKVHARAVPTLGGLGMLVGFLVAIAAAWGLANAPSDPLGAGRAFGPVFGTTSEPVGLLLGVVVICLVGLVDDLKGLSPPMKLAGQIVAALMPVLQGIQLVYAWIPGFGVVVLSPDLGVPLTVLVIVAMINAINFIDGLDGLAAGVVAISAVAFFGFAFGAEARGIAESLPTSSTLVAAALAGISLGFLGHNFHPARIFMGDTGSMLLGLLLATSGVAFIGRTTDPGYVELLTPVPLLIPALVLAIPFADTLFAIVRRLYRRQPIAAPDRGHLHHRLLRWGIAHREAVLTLYFWSIVAAFATVGVVYLDPLTVAVVGLGLAGVGTLLTIVVLRRGRQGRPASRERLRRSG